MKEHEKGTINVWIDGFTPCLKDLATGEIVDTEVIRIRRKTFLRKYNKANGWYIDWAELADDSEIYALVVTGSVDIQGLVSLQKDEAAQAMYIQWMCVAPWNNKQLTDSPRFAGVGGHLFAIAGSKSLETGFEGYVYGFAANAKILEHYQERLGAMHIGILHPYQFAIDAEAMTNILDTYTYGQTDEEI